MPEKDIPEAQPAVEAEASETPEKIRFHYIKSNAFRSIHADGVFGGVTPRLGIAAAFFNERSPLPDQTVQHVREDGTLGEEIRDERISRDGLVRELEVNIVMDVAFAKVLVKWLNEQIEIAENKIKEMAKDEPHKPEEEQSNAVIG